MMQTGRIVILVVAVWLAALLPVSEGQALAAGSQRNLISPDEILALVENAPDESDYPGADAVVLFDGTYIEYSNGLAMIRRQKLVKVFTEWAIDHLGDPRLSFDGARQELEVHASRTYLKDGSTVDTPDNGYNEVTPRRVALSGSHLNIREMVVTHVGIERGVSILLDYSVTDTAPGALPFNRMFFLLDEFPVLKKWVVMEGELMAEVVNPAAGPITCPQPVREGERLDWNMKNLPAHPRHQTERMGDQVPWLAVASANISLSSMQPWPTMLSALGASVLEASKDSGSLGDIVTEMRREDDFLTEREAVERMAEMLTGRTALQRYDPWIFTPLPRSVADCVEASTATPIERAAIMVACCGLRSLQAKLVLPARWETLSRDVPVLEAMADPLVRVALGDGSHLWFDTASGSIESVHRIGGGIPYFVAVSQHVEPLVADRGFNYVKVMASWDLEKGAGRADVVMTGPAVRDLGWTEPEQLARDWAEGWCDSASVEDLQVLSSGIEGIHFIVGLEAPLPGADDRERVAVGLPLPPLATEAMLPDGLDLARSTIDGALFFPAQATADIEWKIVLPEGWELLPGPSVHMVWEDAKLHLERHERPSDVRVVYRLVLGGKPVLPDEYPGFRSLILEATDAGHSRLVFTEEKED